MEMLVDRLSELAEPAHQNSTNMRNMLVHSLFDQAGLCIPTEAKFIYSGFGR